MAQDTNRPSGLPQRLLTIRQTKAELNCSVKSVRRLLSAGALRAVRIGRAVRVTKDSVDSFVTKGGTR